MIKAKQTEWARKCWKRGTESITHINQKMVISETKVISWISAFCRLIYEINGH